MDIDASRLAMMYFAMNYGGIGSRFYFEPGNAVVVNVVCFEETLRVVEI